MESKWDRAREGKGVIEAGAGAKLTEPLLVTNCAMTHSSKHMDSNGR